MRKGKKAMTTTAYDYGRVLVTGAAGRIGTAFRLHVGDRYQLRLADKTTDSLNAIKQHPDEVVGFDLTDLDACQHACAGIGTVLHLGGDPSPEADFYASLLDNNVKATYNIFRAAVDQGCRRVIYASSLQTVEAYELDVQANENMRVRPGNVYGVTKCFGEALASRFADAEGLSSIAVRIGFFAEPEELPGQSARDLSAFVSPRDLSDLFVRCIETPDIPFAIVAGISNNRFKRVDLASTRELLGYEPRDDAFALAGIELHG